jgi:hypothetical protein
VLSWRVVAVAVTMAGTLVLVAAQPACRHSAYVRLLSACVAYSMPYCCTAAFRCSSYGADGWCT